MRYTCTVHVLYMYCSIQCTVQLIHVLYICAYLHVHVCSEKFLQVHVHVYMQLSYNVYVTTLYIYVQVQYMYSLHAHVGDGNKLFLGCKIHVNGKQHVLFLHVLYGFIWDV